MGVKGQMISILRSNETSRIAFSFTGSNGATISVGQASFRRVASALEDGRLSVVEGRFTTNIAMYSAAANSDDNTAANTFYLGNNPRYSRLFNALIVHESVHASFDLTSATLPWLDNEAAAYIAQAYYARNSGLGRLTFDFGSPTIIAYSVVQGMRANNTSDVSFFLDELRNSLNSSPMYHDYIRTTFTGDG